MDEITLRKNISTNIARHRKANNMTQAELAEKINYSDKSVSKWERGDGIPDIYVLTDIAELFDVTVNELVYDINEADAEKNRPASYRLSAAKSKYNIIITMLSCGLVWLVAAIIFVITMIIAPETKKAWTIFIYALPVSSIVYLVLSEIWFNAVSDFIAVSALTWTLAACLHISLRVFAPSYGENAGLFYIVAAVFQLLVILWFTLKNHNYLPKALNNKKVMQAKIKPERKKKVDENPDSINKD